MKLVALLPLFLFAVPQSHAQSAPPPFTRHAEKPLFELFVDTAGVAQVDGTKDQYVTWIYARQSELAPPSSGVLVAFDCSKKLVRRIAHVVFHADQSAKDSTWKVAGNIEVEDSTSKYAQWQAPHDYDILNLVCSVGAQHVAEWSKSTPDVLPSPIKPKTKSPFKET